jgi:hypothetical protein
MIPQAGAQPYNIAFVHNDALVATVNNTHGNPAIYVLGPDTNKTEYRLVRVSDQMELGDFGSLSAATARANAMITSGEVK